MKHTKHHDRTKILVVDDYADAREMYAEYLEVRGFEVITAANGQEALDQVQAGHPDLILMDLSLPILDGWEATRLIKEDASTRNIPVIALSGHALSGMSQTAREAGCDEFVAKPALPEDVEQKIRDLLTAATSPRVRRPGK